MVQAYQKERILARSNVRHHSDGFHNIWVWRQIFIGFHTLDKFLKGVFNVMHDTYVERLLALCDHVSSLALRVLKPLAQS